MKRAFTLAEVLITLAIIGVVAAMTIPNLVQDYQKKVLETSFKNNRAKLIQVIRLMMAQEGADNLSMMRIYSLCTGKDSSCTEQDPDLREYTKSEKFNEQIDYITLGGIPVSELDMNAMNCSGESTNCYQISDGAIVAIYSSSTKPLSVGGEPFLNIYIDTNGKKKPNQLGRDLFYFRVNNSGKLFGMGEPGIPTDLNDIIEGASWQTTCNLYSTTRDYYIKQGVPEEEFDNEWNQMTEEEKAAIDQQFAEAKPIFEMGYGCAGRLIEKGKMDY